MKGIVRGGILSSRPRCRALSAKRRVLDASVRRANDRGGHPITICHRTDSETHPYVRETVDAREY